MVKKWNFKITTIAQDQKIEQSAFMIGGVAFFMVSIFKLCRMDINSYQMLLGLRLSAIFMVLAVGLGLVLSYLKNQQKESSLPR